MKDALDRAAPLGPYDPLGSAPALAFASAGSLALTPSYWPPVAPATTAWTEKPLQEGSWTLIDTLPVSFGGVTTRPDQFVHDVSVPEGTSTPTTRAEALAPGSTLIVLGDGGVARAACATWTPEEFVAATPGKPDMLQVDDEVFLKTIGT